MGRWLILIAVSIGLLLLVIAIFNLQDRAVPSGGHAIMQGRVFTKSDVSLFPDLPLSDVFVLAISKDRAIPLLNELTLPSDTFERFWVFGRIELSEEIFARYIEAHLTSNSTGYYELELPPDDYYVCLANIGHVTQFPVYIYGCIEVKLSESQFVTQNIFWGEGGVTSR